MILRLLWFSVAIVFGCLGADVYRVYQPKPQQKYQGQVRKANHTRVDILYGKTHVGATTCEFDANDNPRKGGGVFWPCVLYRDPMDRAHIYVAVPMRNDDQFDNHMVWRIYKVTKDGRAEIVYRDGEVNI